MNFNYPITITNIYEYGVKCMGWRTKIQPVDVALNGNIIKNVAEISINSNDISLHDTNNVLTTIPIQSFSFLFNGNHVNVCARDQYNNRLTNFVKYDAQKGWIKHCPSCNLDKPLDYFDYSGRHTNEQRDQSQCSECRSQY